MRAICPKCGGMTSVRYDGAQDMLIMNCTVCGYSYQQIPNDRKAGNWETAKGEWFRDYPKKTIWGASKLPDISYYYYDGHSIQY